MYTSPTVDFLYEKTLGKDVGVTYKLFREDQAHAINPIIIDETKDGIPKHIFVPDVVREKEMFYYKYPRLGSYLAIKLEFDSCLSEEAFDAAVENQNCGISAVPPNQSSLALSTRCYWDDNPFRVVPSHAMEVRIHHFNRVATRYHCPKNVAAGRLDISAGGALGSGTLTHVKAEDRVRRGNKQRRFQCARSTSIPPNSPCELARWLCQ